MGISDWRRVEEIVHDALERMPGERSIFVREACGGDDALRTEVESLLANASVAEKSALRIGDLGMDLVGQQVGVYRVDSRIAAGGMGEVYRARDTKLGRDVAIKVLPAAFLIDPDRRARFEREARVLATLNHSNIGAIYGFEESSGVRALVLELVDGETLEDRIARAQIPINEALGVARAIADGLQAAHERGVVHRDLKPANIKIAKNGVVKLLDFGLARAVSGDEAGRDLSQSPTVTIGGTRSGTLLGTAAYMSPEQARAQVADRRADIWAFGCVLYEMLAGTPAFRRATISDTIAAVLEHEPDWSKLPQPRPVGIDRLLRRCLQKDPQRRIHDIADARLEIEEALTDPGSTSTPDRRETSSRRLPWAIAAASLLAAFAASATDFRRTGSAPSSLPPALSRVLRLTNGPAREMAPVVSPDGKWVAYISNTGNQQDVWIKFVAGGDAVNLTASAGLDISTTPLIGGLDVSPDGTRIAVMAKLRGTGGPFATWELPAPLPGAPRKLLEDGLLAMRWSPDGRRITFIRAGSWAGDALWVADADGTNRREIIKAENGMHVHWPAWADDGFIYFARSFEALSNLDRQEIYRVPAQGGPVEPVVSTERRAMYPLPLPAGGGLIYSANPTTADAGLWWRPASGTPRQLTTGIGEYVEPRASADSRTLVLTLNEQRQSLVRIPVGRDSVPPTAVTDGFGGDLDPDCSPMDDQLVFSSARTGNRHLWIARQDGSGMHPLTTGQSNDDRPAFSPDGRQIAFISDRGGQRAVWLINADGGAPRKLIDASPVGGLSWSRDGREIVYAAREGALPGLVVVSVADGAVRHIQTTGMGAEPRWSPAKDVIAYLLPLSVVPARIGVAFVDGSGVPQYTAVPAAPEGGIGFNNGMGAWSRDGRRLAVVSQAANGAGAIWIVEPEAPAPSYRKVFEVTDGSRIRGITWTRDGSAVIIGRHDVVSDIVLIHQD